MITVLLTCVTLIFSAWAFGTVEGWAVLTVQCLTFLAVALALPEIRKRISPGVNVWSEALDWRWAVPLLLLSIFLLIQALNPSHSFSSADYGLTPRDHIQSLPASVAGDVTLQALFKLLTYAAVAWTVSQTCRTRNRRHLLLGSVVAGGFAMSILAILREVEARWNPELTGMFVNENNYAEYANMLIPVALALGRASHVHASAHMHRSHPAYLLYAVAATLATSVFMSGSRAGAIICITSVLAWVTLELMLEVHTRHRFGRSFAFSLLLPAVLAAGLLAIFGADSYRTETMDLEGLTSGLDGRVPILKATVRMFQDRWVFGTGGGTFFCAFPYYQPDHTRHLFFRYTHNDWLQYLSELGVVGSISALALAAGVTWRILTRQHKRSRHGNEAGHGGRRRSLETREERGIIIAIIALFVHACIDFPLHIPAIPLLASAYIGMLYCLRNHAPSRRSSE